MLTPNLLFRPVCRALRCQILSSVSSSFHSCATREYTLLVVPSLSHTSTHQCTSLSSEKPSLEVSSDMQPKVDRLFEKINIEVRGHDFTVLKSYTLFVKNVCRVLDIEFTSAHRAMINTDHSKINRPKYTRWIQWLLRAKFAKKKYKLHYETRTYLLELDVHHLTGSTASAFLEYIERNIPEGVAVKVTYTEMCFLPETIVKTVTNNE